MHAVLLSKHSIHIFFFSVFSIAEDNSLRVEYDVNGHLPLSFLICSSVPCFSIFLSGKEALLLASKLTLQLSELKTGASFLPRSDGIIQIPCNLHYFHVHVKPHNMSHNPDKHNPMLIA